jgi:hypothetical protein
MQPWQFLPRGYEPPLRGEQFNVIWRSDIGSNVSVGGVDAYLKAFQTLLDLGERWGLVMAEEAAARSLIAELFAYSDQRASKDVDLTPVRDVMFQEDGKRIYFVVRRLLDQRTGEHPETIVDVPGALRELASLSVPDLMGSPLRNEAITYRNPIELIIFGGAFVAYGTIQVLRLVRDWGARRRMTNAAAEIAEAEARQARTRADVIEYLGKEVTAGRLHVPASELAKLVTSTDLEAIKQLAGTEPTLELPEGVSEFFGESPPDH